MDTESYTQAVTDMYVAMQEVFTANEKLQRLTQIVWDWDKQPPSPIPEAPSMLLPPSPPSEPEEEVSCECPHEDAKPCVHECSICLKALTLRDSEGLCWMCEEDIKTVEEEWPEDSAEAKEYSIFRNGAFHALVLRFRANNCREAAYDTDDAEEARSCLQDAKRLDEIASQLLYKNADRMFKPWWFKRWDYWMQPGSTHMAPEWAEPAVEPVAKPCGGCNIVNGFHVGICWSQALATGPEGPSIERLPCGIKYVAPVSQQETLPKPDYTHKFWPSPRPKLFAKACAPEMKSMKHQDALEFLANRAEITVNDLLKIDPNTYIQRHMGNKSPRCWLQMKFWRSTYL
jgi:hypothetical protein